MAVRFLEVGAGGDLPTKRGAEVLDPIQFCPGSMIATGGISSTVIKTTSTDSFDYLLIGSQGARWMTRGLSRCRCARGHMTLLRQSTSGI